MRGSRAKGGSGPRTSTVNPTHESARVTLILARVTLVARLFAERSDESGSCAAGRCGRRDGAARASGHGLSLGRLGYLFDLSFRRLMRSTRLLAGLEGAGFVNALFMPLEGRHGPFSLRLDVPAKLFCALGERRGPRCRRGTFPCRNFWLVSATRCFVRAVGSLARPRL